MGNGNVLFSAESDREIKLVKILQVVRYWPNQNPKLVLNIKGKDGQTDFES